MTTLLTLLLMTSALADDTTTKKTEWTEAAKKGDVKTLTAICTAAGGKLETTQQKNGGNMAQPGMDMASMMMANMMMDNMQQQSSCVSGDSVIKWADATWKGQTVKEPAAKR